MGWMGYNFLLFLSCEMEGGAVLSGKEYKEKQFEKPYIKGHDRPHDEKDHENHRYGRSAV